MSTVAAAQSVNSSEERLLPCLTPHRKHPNPFYDSPKMAELSTPETDRVLMKPLTLEDKARALMEERVSKGIVSLSDFEPSRAMHFHEAQRKERLAFQKQSVKTTTAASPPKSERPTHTPSTIVNGPVASQFVLKLPTDEEINKHTGYSEAWVSRVAYTNRLLRLKRTLVQLRTIYDVESSARSRLFIAERKAHDVLIARYFRSFSECIRNMRQRYNKDTRNRIKQEEDAFRSSRVTLVHAPAPPQAKMPSTENYRRRKRGSIDVSDVKLDDAGDVEEIQPAFNPFATIDEIISSSSMVFNPSASNRLGGALSQSKSGWAQHTLGASTSDTIPA